MNTRKNSQKGFTLVELLVVIAIIGILATLLLLQLGVARQRARDAARVAHINQSRTAVELYFDDNGRYPSVATYAALGALLVPRYLTLLPTDPLNTGNYGYRYAFNATTGFHLWSELEQSAKGALGSDADINSTIGWTGEVTNGATETCASGVVIDCIYDQGQLP